VILTSNRGFAEWGEVFGDPVVATALLDRLLHHAVVVQVEGRQLSPPRPRRSHVGEHPRSRGHRSATASEAPRAAAKNGAIDH
jgi:IstB-like ATP binding protein